MAPSGGPGGPSGASEGEDDPERLLLDAMLGTLATYLRICGYDAAYALDRGIEDDEALRELADSEGRRLLTRDESLAGVTEDAVLLTSREVTDQLRELRVSGFDLSLPDRPRRCGTCNGPLRSLAADDERPEYVPDELAGDEIWRCRDCGQYFWRGSHWEDVRSRLEELS